MLPVGIRHQLNGDSGDGFRCFDLGEPLGRTAVGICMGKCASVVTILCPRLKGARYEPKGFRR